MTIDVLKAIPNDPKRNSVAPNLTTTRSSVRRSLFGEVNHEESMEFLKKELEAISKGQKERWNFDFVNEKPINESGSNYEWVPVQQDEVIPKPYALSRLPYLCKNAEILEKDNCNYSQSEEVICRNMSLVQCRIQNNEVTLPKTKLTQTTIHGKFSYFNDGLYLFVKKILLSVYFNILVNIVSTTSVYKFTFMMKKKCSIFEWCERIKYVDTC